MYSVATTYKFILKGHDGYAEFLFLGCIKGIFVSKTAPQKRLQTKIYFPRIFFHIRSYYWKEKDNFIDKPQT
jgi:hypothetical protein